jgi:putative redox protein
MAIVHAKINRDHYRTVLNTGKNSLIGDEPLSNGGQELGFSPSELLAASLGTCTCVTLRMYADRKQWDLQSVEVNIIFERNREKNESNFRREVKLNGNLDAAARERLLSIANQCYVHKILSNPIHINTVLL